MKLIINRITAEFNKIFTGSKRVGDSLKLEGKRMSELDVLNASKLGHKTESALSVKKAVTSDNSMRLASIDANGNPVVDTNGNPTYSRENELRVKNAQFLRDVEPLNLEVDIARRLKLGSLASAPIINVADLIVDASALRVKDSGLLGGKLENQLSVLSAKTADNALKVNNKSESQLTVEQSRITTKVMSDLDKVERSESELRVYGAVRIKKGSDYLDIIQLKNFLFTDDGAKSIVVNVSETAKKLESSDGGNKSFVDIMNYIKDNTSSEAYKAKRLITDDGAKNGDDYKTWIINHNDFKAKVATLNSLTSDRAVRFGSDSENYNITEMLAKIKTITVDQASNSDKVNKQTVDDIIATTRSQILTNASDSNNGLKEGEVSGFFGNNRVKAELKKVTVSASEYLVNSDSSIKKSYNDIRDEIIAEQRRIDTILKDAAYDTNTFSKVKAYIDGLHNSQSTDINNLSTDIRNEIITEKTRIDTILKDATDETNTFSKVKAYIDGLNNSKTSDINNLSTNITKLLNPTKLPVKYDTINVEVKANGESDNLQYRYTIPGKILTYENSMVFVNGIKLRKDQGTYSFTQSGNDTTLVINDTSKISTDDIIEIETLVLA